MISSVVRFAAAELALDFITAPLPHKTHSNFRSGILLGGNFVISSVVRSAGAKLALDFITAPFPRKTHFNFRFGILLGEIFGKSGGAEGTRTPDPNTASVVL